LILSPDGAPLGSSQSVPRIDSTLVKAIARAFRWQHLLEGGQHGSITELARTERINPSYVARILRLTLLAPKIVEAVLDGSSAYINLGRCGKPFPNEWEKQAGAFRRS
jgi:hypothetical protein